ncbi:hypothetical protein AGABI2DRAFT_115873 [Agaricus bisporus var. bisporus H97]|uniref:hypothetical protein n=1 Tax=Agaricus bisporus var. bisporus (strain H97 / ATCC MYA-4626 / FGSC 10389) TaxID=936046 RepID=UPI00029F6399|nr:hypothetical protein AGABI2DRAFT_115873 [Agaricus bisporus var. bisporus H97]EKV48819.1 hypothetical protein AGABI2DRAFT_115873 [Agaricus bisporus var. bisporus H97]
MTHECLDCDRTFASLPAVQSHARVKGHSLPECKDCDRAFVSKDAMTNHLKHSSLHGYCEDCDRFFSTQSSYEQVNYDGHAYGFSMSANSSFNLLQHVADALRHQDPYCKDCDRHFSTEDGYEQHLANSQRHQNPSSEESEEDSESSSEESDENTDERSCDSCNRSFIDVSALTQHLLFHPSHNWCFVCSRDFSSARALAQHSEASPAHRR